PTDAPPDCAFTLVAKHYGIERTALDWIERIALLDSKGPYVWFSTTFGREAKNIAEINKLLSGDVFSWFTRTANQTHKCEWAFDKGMAMVIPWLKAELEYLEKKGQNVALAKEKLQIIDCGHFKAAFFNQKEMRG